MQRVLHWALVETLVAAHKSWNNRKSDQRETSRDFVDFIIPCSSLFRFIQAPRLDKSARNSHSCWPLAATTPYLMTLRVHVCWVLGRMILKAALLPCFPVNGSVRLLGELSWAGVCCSVTWSCISTLHCWLVNWPQLSAWWKTRSKCSSLSETLATNGHAVRLGVVCGILQLFCAFTPAVWLNSSSFAQTMHLEIAWMHDTNDVSQWGKL